MWVVNLAHRFGIKKRRLLGSVWDGSALDETLWRVLKPWWFPDSQMGIWSEQFIGDLTMLEPGEICQGRWLAYPFLQPSREKSNEKDMYVFSDYYWLLLLLLLLLLVVVVVYIYIYIYDVSWTRLPALAEVPWAHPNWNCKVTTCRTSGPRLRGVTDGVNRLLRLPEKCFLPVVEMGLEPSFKDIYPMVIKQGKGGIH